VFSGKRVLVIMNPSSGKARPEVVEPAIAAALDAVGAAADIRRTETAEEPREWAQAARDEGYDMVLAAGGDGTVTAVASGMLEAAHGVPLGIVPMGTGNGLARVLRLPMDPTKAIAAMDKGAEVALDVVRVDTPRCFALFFLGAGLDAEINRDADPASKARFGFLAYLGATVRNLWGRRNHKITLTLDGRSETISAHTVTIFNAGQFELAGLDLGPAVDPHDGYLDVTVLRFPGFWRSLGAVLRLVSGHADPDVGGRRARRLTIAASPPLLVHVDGDVVGSTPLDAEVMPRALRVIAGPDYPALRRGEGPRATAAEASPSTPP
jgi:diacylglycerol kinase (ATP)